MFMHSTCRHWRKWIVSLKLPLLYTWKVVVLVVIVVRVVVVNALVINWKPTTRYGLHSLEWLLSVKFAIEWVAHLSLIPTFRVQMSARGPPFLYLSSVAKGKSRDSTRPNMAQKPLGGLGFLIFRAETSTWQNTTLKTDRHPCPPWDSNPQSQQASGRRPTP